jgi:hypothetical protein
MDTKLNFSSAYHRQTDGQTERTNQVLEVMLRACALQHGSSWDKSLPYAKFSYNNSYQASLKDVTIRGSICQKMQDSSILGPDWRKTVLWA